jgi:predicted component of type VI protein secretion system
MATLRVVSTLARELEGRSFALGAEGTSLGRDGANRVVIPEASVSRRHARIEAVGSVYQLVDQRSSNGTFVNGEQVFIHRLGDGDTVRIGRTTFVFEAGGGTAAAAAGAAAPGPGGPRCEACGAEAPPGSRFCPGCGVPLPQPPGAPNPTPRPASRAPTAPEIPIRPDEAAPAPEEAAGGDEGRAARAPRREEPPTSPGQPPSWPPAAGPIPRTPSQATTAGDASALAAAAPPRSRSAWVIGCSLLALLLLATAAAGLFLLHREGRIDLPGLPPVTSMAAPALSGIGPTDR